jgi:hypothetical protein
VSYPPRGRHSPADKDSPEASEPKDDDKDDSAKPEEKGHDADEAKDEGKLDVAATARCKG